MNSRIECSPRIIKRKNVKEQTDNALKYEFYRSINHLSIIKLNNETDKMNYSSWLIRLDKENTDLKMHLIKLLFISLRSNRSFQMFLKPPPDDLNDLELMFENTMDMVKHLQDINIVEESLTNEDKNQEMKHKRSAAVATDMRSYTTIKTSPYFVQSFYVRSDFPIYTWFNPTSIRLPSSFNHNEWELYLNQFQILTENKDFNNDHRNECDDIIPIEQVTKEVATSFNWHPYSIFKNEANRPKRTAGSIEIDLDVASQQCNQQQIDNAAFSIVFCKVFPGNKILNQKMYTCTLIPDANFIFKMTGVTLVNYSKHKLKKYEQLPNACILRQRKEVSKNSCEDNNDTPRKKQISKVCSKPQLLLPCSTIETKNTKQIIQVKPFINTISTTNTNINTNKVNTENDSKLNNLNMAHQECGTSASKCLKKGVKKTKPIECCKFPKEADLVINNTNESKEPNKCPTILNAGRSSLNDSSKCDWTVSSVEISMREFDRASSGSPPPVEKVPPNVNANRTSLSSDQVARVEPEDQSARHCSNVQLTEAAAASPHPRTAECSREPSHEHRRRRSRGNSDGAISERTASSGRTDTSCIGGRSRTPSAQKNSASEPRDYATARGERSASECGQCPARDQNFTCPAAFPEQQPPPSMPMRTRTDTSDSGATQHQPQQQYQPQEQHQPQERHLHQRRHSQQQQQQQHQYQHQFAVPSVNRSAASVAAAVAPDWDPEVSSYAAFSDRRITEDRSRFMTSERTIDRRLPVVMRAQPSPPPLPANDFRGADYGNLSGSSTAASDWSAEEGFDHCQSCNMQNIRFRDVGDDDNYDDRASSLSTLTSDDSSIEMRLAARHVPNRNVNYDRRTENHSPNANDRYPFDGRLTPNVSDISLRGNGTADVWPSVFDLVEDVSMPGPAVIGPWSLSNNASRSGRVREFGDVRAPDPYDTSCSDEENASGRDNYVDRPYNSFSAFGTDNGGASSVPQRRRSH